MESFLPLIILILLSTITTGDAIVGGVPVSLHRAPFTVLIQRADPRKRHYGEIASCSTGIIVHPKFVLTSIKACSE